ncbi:MAG: NUDIX hydrolase [Clostridiales bacterium]|nr:NUDIX hydrolase [Clostridiales bacterium]
MEQLKREDPQLVEQLLGREVIYRGKSYQFWLDELLLPNGARIRREHLHHPGGVAILALDEKKRCAMVRQYRHPIGQVTLEIPAGKLDKLPNESPEHAALRELREETGYTAHSLVSLGKIYPSPGIIDEVLYLFLAKGLETGQQELDDDEFIHTQWIPIDELEEQIAQGTFEDTKTICALTRARLMKLL